MHRALAIVSLFAASFLAKDARAGVTQKRVPSIAASTAQCSGAPTQTLPYNTFAPVVNGQVYQVTGSNIRVCVERALYPFGEHGHRLWVVLEVTAGDHVSTYNLDEAHFAHTNMMRFEVQMVTKRYTAECDVAVRVIHDPPCVPPKP